MTVTKVNAGLVRPASGSSGPARQGRLTEPAYRYRKAVVAATLIAGDIVAVLGAVAAEQILIHVAAFRAAPLDPALALLLVPTLAVAGLYDRSGRCPYERFRRRTIVVAGFAAFAVFASLPAAAVADLAAVRAAGAMSLLLFGHYFEIVARGFLSRAGLWGATTILVGSGKACRRLANLLASRPDLGLVPIGFIRTGDDRDLARPPVSLIGTSANYGAIRVSRDFDVALFSNAKDMAVASACPAFGASCRFMLAESVGEMQSLWLRTRTLGRMVAIEIRRDRCRRRDRVLKRVFDLLVAIPISVLVLPVVALAAVAIKLVDPGPAFYVQTRVGRNGSSLRVPKLRTMFVDAERRLQEHLARDADAAAEWQRFFKLKRDPRILPLIGDFIRRSSLDEVPQLWNVIRGDMSLVGPRPLPSYHAEKFDPEFGALRSCVTPGITGLWQVSARSDGDLQVLKEMDLFYIRNWSLLLDVYIMLQTVPAVLTAKGAR